MLRELPWYSRHVGRAPGKYDPLLAKKVQEGARLFFGQVSVDPHCFVWAYWVHLMGDSVTVDTEVSSDFLHLSSIGEREDAYVYHHSYFSEFLLCSKGIGQLVDISVAFI